MKTILEFDPYEDKEALYDAQNGTAFSMVLSDLDEELRKTTKYGAPILRGKKERPASALEIKIAEHIRTRIHELLEERGVRING